MPCITVGGRKCAESRSILAAVLTEPTVILVDDHDLFRAGLRNLLEGERIVVAADVRAGENVAALARRHSGAIVLTDVRGEASDGVSLTHELAEAAPDSPVMMLTRSEDPADMYRAIRAGARGYVSKETPVKELAAAIRAVAAGGAWLTPAATAAVLGFISSGRVPRVDDTDMSERELDVLRLLAMGYDNNQIASELSISSKTVKNHISSIFSKLEMTNRVQAAVYAVRSGIA